VEKGARLKPVLLFDVLRSRWYNLYLNAILETENKILRKKESNLP